METEERLLIGNFTIFQDTELYRFTSDSVLLARFVKAKREETVADFCAGSGIVGLHFFAENEKVRHVTFFERDKRLSDMSARTVERNGLRELFTVENTAVQDIPARYTEAFSLILCNPPYEREEGGFEKKKSASCSKELTLTLGELCRAASRCLKFGGRFVLCHRADRLAEVFFALRDNGLEPKTLQFIAGKEGAKPYLALIAAKKGGKRGLDVLPEGYNSRENARHF